MSSTVAGTADPPTMNRGVTASNNATITDTLQPTGEDEHAGKGNVREAECNERDAHAGDCGRLIGGQLERDVRERARPSAFSGR